MSSSPEAETVACDSCSDVIEVVITNSSPDTVVVDFQTSGTLTTASQSHHPWRTYTHRQTARRYYLSHCCTIAAGTDTISCISVRTAIYGRILQDFTELDTCIFGSRRKNLVSSGFFPYFYLQFHFLAADNG